MGRRTWTVALATVVAGASLAAWLVVRPLGRPEETAPGLPAAPPEPPGPETQAGPAVPGCLIRFGDVSGDCGITFQHDDGGGGHQGRHYIAEAMSAGLATFDCDGDGLIDVYLPNGAILPGSERPRAPRHALYKNLGRLRFEEITEQAGVACTAHGLGIAVADYDNDGHADFYLNNFGPNILYRNNGDGTFTDVTSRAGVAGTTPSGKLERKVGAGALFLDYDGDGQVDLHAGNYLELDYSTHRPRLQQGIPFYPVPLDYAPVPDTLYRNNADGTFADASKASGIADHPGRSMGMTAADYNNDGHTDLFVCNDVQQNYLFKNDGRGRFEQVGLTAGVALSLNGEMVANMGVDSADFDRDGWLDFYATNYQNQFKMLFGNTGDGMFEDVAQATGASTGCYPFVNWGAGMVDLDNDGRKEIFVGNGHTEDNIEALDRSTAYRCHNVLLWNTGKGKFVDVSEQCGLQAVPRRVARGVAFDDLDNDGDLDVVILNSRQRPTVLRNLLNEEHPGRHWLQIRLRGVKTNRDGVGAHVRVVAGDLIQLDEVHSGRGYQSHWGSRLHFGLDGRDRVDRIEVRWIGGGVDVLENLPAGRRITIDEGA